MKLRRKLYPILIALPTVLFTLIQILLLLRFICKLLDLDPQFKAIQLLYTVTNVLVFPFIIVLNFFKIPSDGILFEALLLPSVVIYAVVYEFLRIIIAKITDMDDDE